MRTTTAEDIRWMSAALELAANGPAADPNPRVGCVLVQGDSLVAQGWHRGAGTPHAEAVALAAAGERAAGATAYVTLEPCAHEGRTPPCADALVRAGVRRVVIGAPDRSARAGGGAQRLSNAGVDVVSGMLAQEAHRLNVPWEHATRVGRPFVTWKVAATLDGRIAAADGTSRWITSPEARAQVHRLRAQVGAILVGTGTVVADNPALTVRGIDGIRAQPLRVVMGERPLPADAQVLDDAAETLRCATHDPAAVLARLHEREIRHVLIEGGPTVATAFLRAGLVDRIVAYVAPTFLGSGPGLIGDLGVTTIAGALKWKLCSVEQIGDDVCMVLDPERSVSCSQG